MKKCILGMVFMLMGGLSVFPSQAQAMIFISEVLADPAAGLDGDANGDGVRSGSQDEFIEIYNDDVLAVDVSGWSLYDSSSLRHLIPDGTTLNPLSYLVVFGGGVSITDGIVQSASSGGLGLNNSGDTVALYDTTSALVDEFIYGSAGGDNQSLARNPVSGGSAFVKHSVIDSAQGALFSPGTHPDGSLSSVGIMPNPAVPEPLTVFSMMAGLAAMGCRRFS